MSGLADEFYDEDDQGRPVDKDGRIWIECDRCNGEGWYMYSEGDGSDWGEDCPSEIDHPIPCRECGAQCGFWYTPKEEKA